MREKILTDPTDKRSCLCCGQLVYQPGGSCTVEELEAHLTLLEGMGYSRNDLLTTHRKQVEYQVPGMIEWLTAQ